jgi:hypothetical protein
MRYRAVLGAVMGSLALLLTVAQSASAQSSLSAQAGATGKPDVAMVRMAATVPAAPASIVPALASKYVPVTPCRVFDTRPHGATGVCPGAPAISGPFGPGQTRAVPFAPLTGGVVPAGTTAVVLNLTAVNATNPTFLTVYPQGAVRPLASNLNVSNGSPVANLVTVQVGAIPGNLLVYNLAGRVNVIADLEGYFITPVLAPSANGYVPVTPCRAVDTRGGVVGPCSAAPKVPRAKLGPGGRLTVKLTGVGGIPASSTVKAVTLNLTATGASRGTFETVYPAGAALPVATSLNVSSSAPIANLVTVPLSSAGSITIYNLIGTVDVIADIAGYYVAGSGSSYMPVTPCRAFDSRTGTGDCNPSLGGVIQQLQAAVPVQLQIPGIAGMPGTAAGIKAIVFNLTAVGASRSTFLSVYPAGMPLPTISNLNVVKGLPSANLVVVRTSQSAPAGYIQIHNEFGAVDFVVDIAGYYF